MLDFTLLFLVARLSHCGYKPILPESTFSLLNSIKAFRLWSRSIDRALILNFREKRSWRSFEYLSKNPLKRSVTPNHLRRNLSIVLSRLSAVVYNLRNVSIYSPSILTGDHVGKACTKYFRDNLVTGHPSEALKFTPGFIENDADLCSVTLRCTTYFSPALLLMSSSLFVHEHPPIVRSRTEVIVHNVKFV